MGVTLPYLEMRTYFLAWGHQETAIGIGLRKHYIVRNHKCIVIRCLLPKLFFYKSYYIVNKYNIAFRRKEEFY